MGRSWARLIVTAELWRGLASRVRSVSTICRVCKNRIETEQRSYRGVCPKRFSWVDHTSVIAAGQGTSQLVSEALLFLGVGCVWSCESRQGRRGWSRVLQRSRTSLVGGAAAAFGVEERLRLQCYDGVTKPSPMARSVFST